MGKLARDCAPNQEMSTTKSSNESTHARKALKGFSGFITRLHTFRFPRICLTPTPREERNTKFWANCLNE